MTTICGAELFIDGPVIFECDLEPGHDEPGPEEVARKARAVPEPHLRKKIAEALAGVAGGVSRHSAIDKTAAGVEYQVTWTESEPADLSCPSCGHCMAHPDDEHEPDCVVGCSVR
jgi:hypothetical protein